MYKYPHIFLGSRLNVLPLLLPCKTSWPRKHSSEYLVPINQYSHLRFRAGDYSTFQIQKCARGFMGRRKASTRQEELLRERVSVVIQAAWRGLLGRRRAGQMSRDLEAMRVCSRRCLRFFFWLAAIFQRYRDWTAAAHMRHWTNRRGNLGCGMFFAPLLPCSCALVPAFGARYGLFVNPVILRAAR